MNSKEIFDQDAYQLLVAELSARDAAEVLATFLADTAGKLERLSANALDRATTQREAHSIKSSSATFGFMELSRVARNIEANAQRAGEAELQHELHRMQLSFARVRQVAANVLAESRGKAQERRKMSPCLRPAHHRK